jgi:hypothetical protein
MNRLIHISLTILIAATCTSSVIAQTDTLQGSPLYHNATADPIEGERYIVRDINKDTIDAQLRTLQSLYSAGKYHDALQLSHEISNRYPLKKAETLTLLKYTLAANKDLDNDAEADNLAKQYLKKDPFYTPETDDDAPVSFKKVLQNYYTKPKFSAFAALGKIKALPYLDTVRTIIDSLTLDPNYKIEGFVMQFGIEYRPLKIFSISIAPSINTYEIQRSIQRSGEFATFHYYESSTICTLPLYVEAGLYRKREIFVPSFYAGAQMKFLAYSEYKAYVETQGSYNVKPDYKEDLETKTSLNYSIVCGARLNINHRRLTYFADFGLSMDMLPYNDPSKKYHNYDLLYQNLYVPDMFRMLEYTVKFGIKINLQYKTIAKFNYGY